METDATMFTLSLCRSEVKTKCDSALHFAVNEREHNKTNDNGAACSLHSRDEERIQNSSTKI